MSLNVVHARCAGLDVHKKAVVACAMTPEGKQVRTFSTMTRGICQLRTWLKSLKVTHVAMESTYVYWKPIWNLLEQVEGLTLALINAHHLKQVPGRKTDVKDAEWIAELFRHGLVKGSFVPTREIRELRELTRRRRSLIRLKGGEVQRLQKALEGANIKLDSVISDLCGSTGRAILTAMVGGQTDPQELAKLAHPRIQASRQELEEALDGLVQDHQRFMLHSILTVIGSLQQAIEELDEEVAKRLVPFEETIERIDEVPGWNVRSAQDALAEFGPTMETFPSADHATSWAKVCPGSHESAGKRKNGKTGRGNPWLAAIFRTTSMAAVRKKGSHWHALYHRLAGRRGKPKALKAVTRHQLIVLYHIVRLGKHYVEPVGPDQDPRVRDQSARRMVRRLEKLGYQVQLIEPTPQVA